jgi:NTP pyrophosphatase (non-canonical NTP hydrolase)
MVQALAKSGVDILNTLSPIKCHILHMAILASEEAGESLGAIKKHIIYDKELDRENLVEELGDLEFALQGLRSAIGISRAETLEHNLNKLLTGDKARYKEGKYSNEQAQNRADKQ